jgi:hypothetical protein
MITYLLIFFAAFTNGMLDTMCFNEDNSLFTYWGKFWIPRKAKGFYKEILGVTLDGYHLVKYLMIFSIFLAAQFGGAKWYISFILWGIGFELSRKIFKKQ